MRSPSTAIVWEIWAAHRRSWLLVLAVVPIWAMVCQVFSDNLHHSDLIKGLSFIPAMLTTSLVMSIFNFTEVNHRKGFAGFPQRFFTAPMKTWSLVAIPMACGVAGVVLLYFAWALCVFRPAGVDLMIRWPAILLAVAVVFYQSIIWCLSGFRITRLIVLGIVMTYLVAVGFIPFMPTKLRGDWNEARLTIILAVMSVGAFAASVLSVGSQRRGGGQGWAWRRKLVRRLSNAIPHVQWNLKTPDRALLWMEWRRSGLVLPAAVLVGLGLIMGPASWIAGYGSKATALAVSWISILPILLAIPVGQGLAKPDFWSLELALSPFLTTQPITGANHSGQDEVGGDQHVVDLGSGTLGFAGLALPKMRSGISARYERHASHGVCSLFTMGHSRAAHCCRHAADLELVGRRHLARILRPHLVFLHVGRTEHRRFHCQLDFLHLVI